MAIFVEGGVTQVTIFAEFGQIFGWNWFRNQGTEKTKEKTQTIGFSELQFSGDSNRDPFYPVIGGHFFFERVTYSSQKPVTSRIAKLSSKKLSHQNVSSFNP